MSRNITSLIGGIIIIVSVFLPILSIFTTYKGYNIIFHYWAVGIMYVDAKSGDNGTERGTELSPNIIGIGIVILLVVFGILIIIRGLEGKGSNSTIAFGIISMVSIVSFTALMYFALWNALYNIGLGNIVSSLMPSYGFYVGLSGGIIIIIGGAILKKSTQKPREEKLEISKQSKSQKIETKICQKCGETNRFDDNFCVECGAAMK
jgi:hypothetical protein